MEVLGKRALVVDDVANTDQSIRQTVAALRAAGGDVLAAGALVDPGMWMPRRWACPSISI